MQRLSTIFILRKTIVIYTTPPWPMVQASDQGLGKGTNRQPFPRSLRLHVHELAYYLRIGNTIPPIMLGVNCPPSPRKRFAPEPDEALPGRGRKRSEEARFRRVYDAPQIHFPGAPMSPNCIGKLRSTSRRCGRNCRSERLQVADKKIIRAIVAPISLRS